MVKVLRDADFVNKQVYDLRVPENVAGDYIWIGRSGRESWESLNNDDCEFRVFIDIELWGTLESDPQAAADDVRKFLNELPAGAFGYGRCAGVDVTDQRDEYEPRNQAGDDYVLNGQLSAAIVAYLET